MDCQYCNNICVRNGKQKDGTQKYRCKACKKYQQKEYRYEAKVLAKRRLVVKLLVNNCGFAGISRVLGIAENTVTKIVFAEAIKVKKPALLPKGVYELDEIQAYKKKGKDTWAVYALERHTGIVTGISTGKRNKQTLRKTVNAVLATCPRKIYTDGLHMYKNLVPAGLHKTARKMLCRIERLHLTA